MVPDSLRADDRTRIGIRRVVVQVVRREDLFEQVEVARVRVVVEVVLEELAVLVFGHGNTSSVGGVLPAQGRLLHGTSGRSYFTG